MSARDLFTAEDKLVCENTEVRVFTTCPSDSKNVLDSDCIEQYFLFVDMNKKTTRKVRASGRLERIYEDVPGREMEKSLESLALDWACLRGRDGSYVLIGYSNGGNCVRCEWDEIFDLKGHRLASSEVRPSAKNKEEERILEAFDKKYEALGLPLPWPHSSFQLFRYLKHSYKPD